MGRRTGNSLERPEKSTLFVTVCICSTSPKVVETCALGTQEAEFGTEKRHSRPGWETGWDLTGSQ